MEILVLAVACVAVAMLVSLLFPGPFDMLGIPTVGGAVCLIAALCGVSDTWQFLLLCGFAICAARLCMDLLLWEDERYLASRTLVNRLLTFLYESVSAVVLVFILGILPFLIFPEYKDDAFSWIKADGYDVLKIQIAACAGMTSALAGLSGLWEWGLKWLRGMWSGLSGGKAKPVRRWEPDPEVIERGGYVKAVIEAKPQSRVPKKTQESEY